jgi:hypothetical protein
MARLVDVANPPEDILRQEGFGISSEGVAVAPEVAVTFPRLVDAELPEDLVEPVQVNVPYSGGAEAARAAAQGLTMGFGEEIEAGLRAPFSDEDYTTIRDRLRAQQSQFGKDYPKTQLGLEIASGLAVPTGILGAAYKTGAGAMQLAKTGAKAGAATGAITGAGIAPEISDIPSYAGTFGVAGAGFGGAAPVAIKASGNVIRNLVDGMGLTNASNVASRKLQEYFNKEELTPKQVIDMLEEYRRLGVPNPVIADISDNLRNAGYASYVPSSKSKSVTEQFLENRQSELAGSIQSGLQRKSGVNTEGRFGFDYVRKLADTQAEASKKAYPKATSMDIPATPFRKYADRDLFAKAYEEAKKIADAKGEVLPELSQIRNAQFINSGILQRIKIGLDEVVAKETDVLGKTSGYGTTVKNVRREFNDLIKYYNKDYAKANQEFADFAKLKEAYSDGLDYMKMETSELKAALKKMTPAEKESFRVGMISEITNKLSKFKGGNPIREVFQSDRQKEALKFAFDNESQFNDFVRQLEATKDLMKTFNKTMRGSTTTEKLSALDEDAKILSGAKDFASGNIGSAIMNILGGGMSRARGFSPEVSDVMKQRLFTPNAAKQSEILNAIRTPQTPSSYANPATYSGLLGEIIPLMEQ